MGLDELREADVIDALARDGKLLVRGCGADLAAFQRFVDRFSSTSLSQEAGGFRDNLGHGVSSVVKGAMGLALHMERGYSPDKPELCFFLAITPALSGGEMLFGDGETLYAALPAPIRDLLGAQRLVYRLQFGPEVYVPRYGTREQITTRFPTLASIRSFRFLADEVLEYEHVTSALLPGRTGPAFLNSLVLGWENMRAGRAARVVRQATVSFEDGTPIDDTVVRQICEAIDPVTERVALDPGDVAVVDNFRCMHGRTAFTGDRRAGAAFGQRRY